MRQVIPAPHQSRVLRDLTAQPIEFYMKEVEVSIISFTHSVIPHSTTLSFPYSVTPTFRHGPFHHSVIPLFCHSHIPSCPIL